MANIAKWSRLADWARVRWIISKTMIFILTKSFICSRCMKNSSLQSTLSGSQEVISALRFALSVEDLSSQDQLEKYDLKHTRLDVNSDNRKNISFCKFHVYSKRLPPNYQEETSLCIVPMSCYKKNTAFSSKNAVFASIDEYDKHGYMRFRSYPENRSDYEIDDGPRPEFLPLQDKICGCHHTRHT